MKKFTTFFILTLFVFIIFGLIGVIFSGDPKPTATVTEVESVNRAPGYTTMMDIATIVEEQLSEKAILDLFVTPKKDGDHVTLKLLRNDIVTEDQLLKDSYHILLESSSIESITSFSLSWQLNDELVVMDLSFDKDALSSMVVENYATIPAVATTYFKHNSMY